eukprot:1476586-Prymnesium_polylepis.1
MRHAWPLARTRAVSPGGDRAQGWRWAHAREREESTALGTEAFGSIVTNLFVSLGIFDQAFPTTRLSGCGGFLIPSPPSWIASAR